MDIRKRFIDRLKYAMNDNNINARELSKKCGLSESSISRYLSGDMEPRVPAIGKMAQALHVDPVWLMGYDEGPEPEFSIETMKIAMLIEYMKPDEKAQVDRFVKFIIDSRGGDDKWHHTGTAIDGEYRLEKTVSDTASHVPLPELAAARNVWPSTSDGSTMKDPERSM